MLALVLLVFLALMKGSDGCLMCSRALKEALRELREHHVPDRSQGYDQKRAQTALDELVRTYQRYDFMAQYILDRLTIDLKREIVGIIKQNLKAHFLAAAVINFGFKAHEIITMETNHFTNNIECSNSCGNFTLLFRQCIDCHPLFISCMMGIRCGATDLMVGENDELSLDCFQTWHKITSNFKSYIFSQAPLGSRNEWQFQKIAETHESSLEILQVSKEHEKTYQCVVMGNEGRPIAKILYNVRVVPLVSIPTEQGHTLPPPDVEEGLVVETPPPSQFGNALALDLISFIALALFGMGLLSLGGLLCYTTIQWQRKKTDDEAAGPFK